MRAELVDVPCTWTVIPVPFKDCASWLLVRVSRTIDPVSTFSLTQAALVANETAYGSPPGTSTACTIARYRPGGPLSVPVTGEVPLREACSTWLGSMTDSVMNEPG